MSSDAGGKGLDLDELLRRMSDQTRYLDSRDSDSWQAHRDAEKLTDPDLLAVLDARARVERDKNVRRSCYFAMGKVGGNSSVREAAVFLLEAISREQDKYLLSVILEALSKVPKPSDLDLSPIFEKMGDKRWLVRHAAIEALRGAANPAAEERVLAYLQGCGDYREMAICQYVLNSIGTSRSVAALSANLKSRSPDVRMTADLALKAVRSRTTPT